jgi:gas vesicle protein
MAFASEEVKSNARALLLQGKKTAEIIATLPPGSCTGSDIKNIIFNMRKGGELPKFTPKSKTAAKPERKAKQQKKTAIKQTADDLAALLQDELDRLNEQNGRFNDLIHAYANKNNDFCEKLERKVSDNKDKILAIEALVDTLV